MELQTWRNDNITPKGNEMKILFFINAVPPQYGGGFLRVTKIAARFNEDNWLYKIITFTPYHLFKDFMGLTKDNMLFIKSKILSTITIPYSLIIHNKEFDVLYVASTHWFTVIPTLVCKLLGKKIVLGVTLSNVDSPAVNVKGVIKKTYYKFKNSQFKIADYIFVNSPLLVKECEVSGFQGKVKLINNPVNINIFHPISEKERTNIREELGINNGNETFLFVGSINNRKGTNLFPLIFDSYIKKTNKCVNFIICGEKGYKESQTIIDNIKNILKKNKSVFLVKENVKDVHRYYQMADVFLFPTTNEGMPNVVLEAMASGCMIICNTLTGITDYSLKKEFLIINNNVEEYVNRMIDFNNNKNQYMKLIQENIQLIKDEFSISKVDQQIKDLLND